MHKGRNRWGRGDLKVQEAWLEERSKRLGVLMMFGVELLLLLKSTLQGSDLVL